MTVFDIFTPRTKPKPIRSEFPNLPSQPKTRWQQQVWQLLVIPLVLFLTIPVLVLLFRSSPAALLESIQQVEVRQAVWISLKTTLISMGIILLMGTPVAYLLGRYRFRLKGMVSTFIDLPTVLPPSVAGVALLMTFGRRGILGSTLDVWGMHIAFSQAAVVMAQIFIAAPYYVRSAAVGFGSIDAEIEQAAQMDGASGWQVFRFILLPLAGNALTSGAVMSWARSLGEFGATILFAGNLPGKTQTMPLAIYLGFESSLQNALTLSVILIVISFVSLMIVRGMIEERE